MFRSLTKEVERPSQCCSHMDCVFNWNSSLCPGLSHAWVILGRRTRSEHVMGLGGRGKEAETRACLELSKCQIGKHGLLYSTQALLVLVSFLRLQVPSCWKHTALSQLSLSWGASWDKHISFSIFSVFNKYIPALLLELFLLTFASDGVTA